MIVTSACPRRDSARALARTPVSLPDEWVVVLNDEQFPVHLDMSDVALDVRVGGKAYRVESDWRPGEDLFLGQIDGDEICIQIDPAQGGWRMRHGGFEALVKVVSPLAATLLGRMPPGPAAGASKQVLSPMPGLLVSLQVEEGQEVRNGEPLAVIEAMKMENQILAERDGVIGKILLEPGDALVVSQVIMEFE